MSRGKSVRVLGRMAVLGALACAVTGFSAASLDSRILFSRGSPVPPLVQKFAWRVIEERCNYLSYEREQRSFWAYETRARAVDEGTAYSISIVADLGWWKTTPSAFIAMTIVDDGRLRVTALQSSFIVCSL
jgi:hypothetical protein